MFQQPLMTPGLHVQSPMIAGSRIAAPALPMNPTFGQTIPTSSIKYTAPTTFATQQVQQVQTYQAQPIIQQSHFTGPVQTYAASPIMATTTQVSRGCPPPVQGQPIVIEGVVTGAQSYIEPVRSTVLLQGAQVRPELSQVKLGEKKVEYIPYEQVVTEYDQIEKRIRIPYNKYITEYQVVEHQIEYHPEITYQTETDYVPQNRIEEEVQYQTQEKRYETGWNKSMRTSQKIEGAVNILQSQQRSIVQAAPVQQVITSGVTYQQPQIIQSQPQVITSGIQYQQSQMVQAQPQVITSGIQYQQPQVITSGVTYAQAPVSTQWPTAWTNTQVFQQKRKTSS